eukprot:SAG31_NODE_1611_length_7748_cov_2.128758_10_plen_134_part_00
MIISSESDHLLSLDSENIRYCNNAHTDIELLPIQRTPCILTQPEFIARDLPVIANFQLGDIKRYETCSKTDSDINNDMDPLLLEIPSSIVAAQYFRTFTPNIYAGQTDRTDVETSSLQLETMREVTESGPAWP